MERKEVLVINVNVEKAEGLDGQRGSVCMLHFSGDASGSGFNGKVIQGGIDTQVEMKGEKRTLSARYILEGTDADGNDARIYIENNGAFEFNEEGNMITKPFLLTNSKSLAWLEDCNLTGAAQLGEKVVIKIYADMA